MDLHSDTYNYLKPADYQLERMEYLRKRTAEYSGAIEGILVDGPDKTYILRKLRELSMWINVCITRNADGSPRE